jgi:hypothetical protein
VKFTSFVVGAVALLVGCQKSDANAAGGPSASGAATPPPSPAAAPGPVKYTTGDAKIAGDYDGTKAIARRMGSRTIIALAKNCDALSCDHLPSSLLAQDKVKAACPNGYVLTLQMEQELTAGAKVPLTNAVCSQLESGAANGLVLSGASKNEVEVVSAGDSYVVKISLDGMEGIQGVASAKLCK